MRGSIRDQIKSGLRLGCGVGAFLIALIFLGMGLHRIVWSAPSSGQIEWLDWVGWVEVVAAVTLLMASAHVWHWLLAGIALFGFFKCIVVLVSGGNLYGKSAPLSRMEATELAGFTLATLALLFRFKNNPPTIPDRVALTIYVIALSWIGNIMAQLVGLLALLIAWGIDWRRRGLEDAV